MFFPPRCISFSYYSHGLRVISEAVLSWEQKYGLSFWWMDLKFYLTQDDSYIIPNKFYLSWCIICLEALSSRQDMPEIKNNISRGSKNPIWLIFNFFPKLLKRFYLSVIREPPHWAVRPDTEDLRCRRAAQGNSFWSANSPPTALFLLAATF